MAGRFVRLGETDRNPVTFFVDGNPVEALEGDTLMVAMLNSGKRLRSSEFDPSSRAGFCLMGACQDCWVRAEDGTRLRTCSTVVAEGMKIITANLENTWAELS